ncbi:nucleotidyltransferase family protein [Halorhodospira halophila]|uniref:nucleotidyltransferase family protein n=1 Tax=Halorhodospira halophila TaxID=1053 RepID=UPI0019138566|nr:nucleotidyltransferase domain-containing protein [Halorhodospira halophila]
MDETETASRPVNAVNIVALRAALEPQARTQGWRLVVLFGSVARSGTGRDLDLAVLPVAVPDLMTQGRWSRRLEEAVGYPVDLLVLHDGISPLVRFHAFRDGICLYEAEPCLFDHEQRRAFFLHADAQLFLRRDW